MTINWYPGHMHKARKDILQTLKHIDLIIELVDARLPFSSQNPIIAQWRQEKPTLIILNKSDLADASYTESWQIYFEQKTNIQTLAYHKDQPSNLEKISRLCRTMTPRAISDVRATQAMVLGIPNVGKSTLINALVGRNIAKVGDEPAITKRQQKIRVDNQITLHDTPGILWPRIENPNSGYRLAITGAIKNTAVTFEDIGDYAAEYLLEHYPNSLQERYQFKNFPKNAVDCLEAIGARRGTRQAGGSVNLHKAAEILIHDFRSGNLGALSLETPEHIEKELIEVRENQRRKKEAQRQRKLRGKNG
ncbi:MAG: ribosome biogenesis GTPase A [Cellvibrionaceae bacterium]|jgi:ribosome biogenesis GTPase A